MNDLGVTGAGVLATSPGIASLHPSVPGVLLLMNPGSVPFGVNPRLRLLQLSPPRPRLRRTLLDGSVTAAYNRM